MEKRPTNQAKLTPLWIISLFLGLTETIVGIAATQTEGMIQLILVIFCVAYPIIVAIGFFIVLWYRPIVFYSPTDFPGRVTISEFADAIKMRKKVDKEIFDVFDRIFWLLEDETKQQSIKIEKLPDQIETHIGEQAKKVEQALFKLIEVAAHSIKQVSPDLVEQRNKVKHDAEKALSHMLDLMKKRDSADEAMLSSFVRFEKLNSADTEKPGR